MAGGTAHRGRPDTDPHPCRVHAAHRPRGAARRRGKAPAAARTRVAGAGVPRRGGRFPAPHTCRGLRRRRPGVRRRRTAAPARSARLGRRCGGRARRGRTALAARGGVGARRGRRGGPGPSVRTFLPCGSADPQCQRSGSGRRRRGDLVGQRPCRRGLRSTRPDGRPADPAPGRAELAAPHPAAVGGRARRGGAGRRGDRRPPRSRLTGPRRNGVQVHWPRGWPAGSRRAR